MSTQVSTGLGKFVIEDQSTDVTQAMEINSSSGLQMTTFGGAFTLSNESDDIATSMIIKSITGMRLYTDYTMNIFTKTETDTETLFAEGPTPGLSSTLPTLKISSYDGLSLVNSQRIQGTGRFILEDKSTDIDNPMALYSASGFEIYSDTTADAIIQIQSENNLLMGAGGHV